MPETSWLQQSFPANLRNFLEHQFCVTYDYHMLYKIGVLQNLAIFTAKLTRTAGSGITERIYLLHQAENLVCFAGLTVSQYLRY